MGCSAYGSVRGKKHFPSIRLSLEQVNTPAQLGLWLSPDVVLLCTACALTWAQNLMQAGRELKTS